MISPPKFHVVFDDEFSTYPFMGEEKYTWFTLDLEEYPIKTPTHVLIFVSENNKIIITPSQPVKQVHESPVSKGASFYEVIECTVSK